MAGLASRPDRAVLAAFAAGARREGHHADLDPSRRAGLALPTGAGRAVVRLAAAAWQDGGIRTLPGGGSRDVAERSAGSPPRAPRADRGLVQSLAEGVTSPPTPLLRGAGRTNRPAPPL